MMISSKMPTGAHWVADRWALVLALTLAILTVLLLASSIARAQERPSLPELHLAACPEASGLHAQELDGARGMWFPRPTAECMLGRLTQLGELVPYVRLLEERLTLDDERNALQARRVALAAEEAHVAEAALEAALRRAREAEEALDAWYRSPLLWFAVGVVVTIVLEVAAVVALSEIRP